MRHAATTFVTVAFLVLTAALPSKAAEPEPSGELVHLAAGVFATTVQLSIYGGCLAFGGEHSSCVERADVASRRAVGRSVEG